MTKKHFIELADWIVSHNTNYPEPFTTSQIELLAQFCKAQNPNFNRERWLGYIAGTNGSNGGRLN